MPADSWSPASWRGKPIEQVPVYADATALAEVERQLAGFPPLVFAGEARKLKRMLGKVADGEAFLLQGGDCAESFAEHSADNIRDFFPRVSANGRGDDLCRGAAGRQAWPHRGPIRQAALGAERNDRRGRAAELSRRHRQRHRVRRAAAREPDPARQLMAYRQSAATLNLLRAFATGGYANLENAHGWMLGFIKDSPQSARYQELADRITETLGFMRAIGLDPEAHQELRQTDFYTSHEALLLGYRAGADPRRFDDRRLLRDLRPYDLDRRPHPPAGPCPCRICTRREKSARPQMRPDALARRIAETHRYSQSSQ